MNLDPTQDYTIEQTDDNDNGDDDEEEEEDDDDDNVNRWCDR